MLSVTPSLEGHKLLIASHESATTSRIIRTAKRSGLKTVAVHTPKSADSTSSFSSSPLSEADESSPLRAGGLNPLESAADDLIAIALRTGCTMIHPGHGFHHPTHDADFAIKAIEAGITWLGPRPDIVRSMSLKHEFRRLVRSAGVSVVPGSDGLVKNGDEAAEVARTVGYPVALKAAAGHGGLEERVFEDELGLRLGFEHARGRPPGPIAPGFSSGNSRPETKNGGLLLEQVVRPARYIEVQVRGSKSCRVFLAKPSRCSEMASAMSAS